jgi:uncharacterized membrane protein YphA (DoxX/SURF4 family)
MFPAGAPGVGLLVLRNCIAVALAGSAFSTGWEHAAFLALLSLLCAGLLTPAVCIAAAAALVFSMADSHAMAIHPLLLTLSTLSLAFLGPGAYSVDSRLFGRRVLVSTADEDSTTDDRDA